MSEAIFQWRARMRGMSRRWSAWSERWRDCLPRALRQWWDARQPPRLLAQVRGTELHAVRVHGAVRSPLGSLDARAEGNAAPLPRPRQGWREIVLELPEDAVLLRRARLPAQARDRLTPVVAYEIDRFTPFAASEVYFDARALDGGAPPGQLEFELAVCRRDRTVAWLERLRRAGAPATRLTWNGAWPGANLLPLAERPRPNRAALALTVALAILVGLLTIFVLLSPLWQKRHEQERIERLLREVRRQAEEVPVLREELERARAGSLAVLERKALQPRMIDLLRELSERLPDDTWVQTLNFTETEVDLRGQSEQSTALLAVLEQAPGITNVAFRSPVMQVAQSSKERFHIAFMYRRPR